MAQNQSKRPRTFFLNEEHQLAPERREGGGRLPNYSAIDWTVKAQVLTKSLADTKRQIEASPDPTKSHRFYMMAVPTPQISKFSEDSAKGTKTNFVEDVDFAKDHAQMLGRLGMDVLEVEEDGKALVHAERSLWLQFLQTTASLSEANQRQKNRWIAMQSFEPIGEQLRADDTWIASLNVSSPADVVLELQPMLSRQEVEDVVSLLAKLLEQSQGERFVASGTDYSGRHWYRGMLTKQRVRDLAQKFFSINSLHAPLTTAVAESFPTGPLKLPTPPPPTNIGSAPQVAIVDCGIPDLHPLLDPYRRGAYRPPGVTMHTGDHGSKVASVVVYGDVDKNALSTGDVGFIDVMVGKDENLIDDKAVMSALQAVVGVYRDVRVFNMSFGDRRPLSDYSAVERRVKLAQLRDLDNFIFASDILVVVAAGNAPAGAPAIPPYPNHLADPRWGVGTWASGFNTLTCGAFVKHTSSSGLAPNAGWPSPFSKCGPGLAGAPVPDFSEHGGNVDANHNTNGLGLWVSNSFGRWMNAVGTSFAAPLLARQAAFAFSHLARVCVGDARPFACTVRAFLAITSEPPLEIKRIKGLPRKAAKLLTLRTLGMGRASAARLAEPKPETALFVWQGILPDANDVVRVQVPVPRIWLSRATQPILRISWAWDSPVNDAPNKVWACRQVVPELRPNSGGPAYRGGAKSHASYTLVQRRYELNHERLAKWMEDNQQAEPGDLWTLDLHYKIKADYYPGQQFSSEQRVAFVAELSDESAAGISPQVAVQSLPIAATMIRMSTSVVSSIPVQVRT